MIAQVHGYALGGGSTVALTCDLTMMADDAKIGYPPTRWLAPGDNTAVFAFMAGLKKGKEMMFGRMFSGKEAAEIGMINYSFPAEELEEGTRTIARRIATIPPELLMLNKTMFNRVWEIIGIKTAMEVAGEFVRRGIDAGENVRMGDFLERASLTSDSNSANSKKKTFSKETEGSISLMTLHLAKGLEFKAVFLVGLEEGVLPHVRSLNERSALEEERRLCYVGFTRAREKLYLSRAYHRQSYGRGSFYSGETSRFLEDVPSGVLSSRWSDLLERSAR